MKLIIGMAVAAALLGACGDDGGSTAAGAGPDVSVEAADYAFVGLPKEIPAGSTVGLRNTSRLEAHELVAFRVPDHEKRSAQELLALPQAEAMEALGGKPAIVVIAAPRSDGFAPSGGAMLAERGRYVIVCTVPTGADPKVFIDAASESEGPPDVPGGSPHFVHGMLGEITVV